MSVSKVDGIGTRKDGSGGETANFESRVKSVRLHATEAIAKGDIVALDFTLDGSSLEQDPGHGIRIRRADSDDTTDDEFRQGIGVALEAISSGSVGPVQVSGRCNVCKVKASIDVGLLIKPNTTPGDGAIAYASGDIQLPLGMLVKFGTADTADSQVLLFNPCNL